MKANVMGETTMQLGLAKSDAAIVTLLLKITMALIVAVLIVAIAVAPETSGAASAAINAILT